VARRIIFAVLALIIVALSAVAVPLGVVTSGQDRRDYTDEALSSASTLANVAEERLDDGIRGPALDREVRQLARAGDLVSVFDAANRRVTGTDARPPVTTGQLNQAVSATSPPVYQADGRITVIMPVLKDAGAGKVGTVVLARPAGPIDARVARLWAQIAAVCAAALLAALLVAIGLARWVSRPLRYLEAAARQLGDGDLGTRSPSSAGPAEVRGLAGSFNQMAARLESLVDGHRAMMADVSHQLRTPLAALRLRLELLAEDSDDTAAAELAGAQDEIARLTRLVNGLLAVAKAENAGTTHVVARVDEIVRARMTAWQPSADDRGITLQAELAPVTARAGDGQLEQILDNLIANALDAVQPGGTVTIASSGSRDRVRIAVSDDGPGMTPAQQRLAFRRFATSDDGGGGSGLGLAIVHRLAVSNGGSATLTDTPGGGLTVTIEVPAPARGRATRRS
jgi:signal transduction histidine kinase